LRTKISLRYSHDVAIPLFKHIFRLILALLVTQPFLSQVSSADDGCSAANSACREIGNWEFSLAVGLGGRSNPIVGGDDQPILLVPSFSWYGKRFFIDTFEAGFTFVDTEKHMLNAIAQPSFDQVYFDEFGFGNFALGENFSAGGISESVGASSGLSGAPVGGADSVSDPEQNPSPNQEIRATEDDLSRLRDRNMAALAGLEYSYFNGPWQIQAAALQDISGVHDGTEIRLAVSYQHIFDRNQITFASGLAWQSQDITDYYYGLDASEVSRPELEFKAESGIARFAKISWTRKLNKRWALVSTIQLRQFDSNLQNSPLLEESTVVTGFIGGRYHF